MDIKATFRQNATQYGCSEEEMNYIENLLPLRNTNIVFTFKQFKVFCKYWRQYNGV